MFTPTWITEKELAREIKKQRIRISLEEQHEIFFSGDEKMRNASDQQGEKCAAVKKKKRTGTQAAKCFVSKYDCVSPINSTRTFYMYYYSH